MCQTGKKTLPPVERDLIAVNIQFEYDPDDLATKITTQLVHKSNSKTYV